MVPVQTQVRTKKSFREIGALNLKLGVFRIPKITQKREGARFRSDFKNSRFRIHHKFVGCLRQLQHQKMMMKRVVVTSMVGGFLSTTKNVGFLTDGKTQQPGGGKF